MSSIIQFDTYEIVTIKISGNLLSSIYNKDSGTLVTKIAAKNIDDLIKEISLNIDITNVDELRKRLISSDNF